MIDRMDILLKASVEIQYDCETTISIFVICTVKKEL